MNDPEQHSSRQAQKPRGGNSLPLEVSGIVASAASGVLAAWYSAQRNFNNRVLQKMEILRPLRSERDKALARLGINEKSIKALGELGTDEKMIQALRKQGTADKNIIEAAQEIYTKYHKGKKVVLESNNIKYPWQKFRMLDKYGKAEAIIGATAVTSAAIGVVLGLVGMRNVSRRQDELEERLRANDGPQR